MSVFGKCDILLPNYTFDSDMWRTWSVIACDQHTSDKEYWDDVGRLAGASPSTLGLILPEAYLGTDREDEIKRNIETYPEQIRGTLKEYKDALVYVERTLSSGMIRRGLVGAISLDAYDYEPGTTPEVRPTEGTVKERIPPRVAVRRASYYEASHVMLFTECRDVFDLLTSEKPSMPILYDFDLMKDGGHIVGRLVSGDTLDRVERLIEEYENCRRASGEMAYGVGDGNHSLASAKAYLEELRRQGRDVGGAQRALVELVPISERSIVFEPIYKAVTGVDFDGLINHIKSVCAGDGKEVTALCGKRREIFSVPCGDGEIVCGALQSAIDSYLSAHGGDCDYIHGKDELMSLASGGAVGFLFDGIEKDELFPFVTKHGVLPRKAFSMGEACEKRYYTELRKLK